MSNTKVKITSLQDLRTYIHKLEQEYDLYNLDVSGVNPWMYQRVNLYYTLAERLRLMQQPHTKMHAMQFITNIPNLFISLFFKNPLLIYGDADVLMFPHPRIKFYNNDYIDTYTKFLKDDLTANKKIIYT